MSDVMLYGILSMPYEMAMSDELSRFQFYKTVQRLLEKDSQQQAEIEALKANRKHDFGLGEASGFIKGHKENPYQSITNTKIEPTVVSYTHPAEALDMIDELLKEQQAEIEKLRSWVEMLVEVPFFDEIDHYRGIPVSILRKAEEE